MTKQEEIKAGIARIVKKWYAPDGHPEEGYGESCEHEIMVYLHSQGVAIKVDGELPEYEFFDCAAAKKTEYMQSASNHTIRLMSRAGYVKTIPIKEET